MAKNDYERPYFSQFNNPGFEAGEDIPPKMLAEEPSENSSDLEASRSSAGGKCCCYLWKTNEMVDPEDDDEAMRITIRNLVIYVVYIVVLCIITYGRVTDNNYFFPKVVQAHFLDQNWEDGPGNTYRDAENVDNFWSWAEGPLMEGLYWEEWYNNDETKLYPHYIMSGMKLLGFPRIRQVRIKTTNNECRIPEVVAETTNSSACVPQFEADLEDKADSGTEWRQRAGNNTADMTAWTYRDEEELGTKRTAQWAGAGDVNYPDGGFLQNLAGNNKDSTAILEKLKSARWIDEGTAAVIVDFTVFNPNVNLFCQVQIMAEFPEYGGLAPSWHFATVSLLRYETVFDFFVLACEFLFILFTLYYLIEEIIEIVINKLRYFKTFFNILDVVIIGLSIAWSVFFGWSSYRIYVDNEVKTLLREGSKGTNGAPSDYISLDGIVTQLNYLQTLSAVVLFFAWIKFFKFLSFSKTMNQLAETISRSLKDIFGFCIMFFLVFFAFAQFAFLLFGTKLEDFSSFGDCVFTQLRIILGDFDYPALEEASNIFGPVYFFLYIFFVFFVLINMFLAIIADTYSTVKEDMEQTESWAEQRTQKLVEKVKSRMAKIGTKKKKILGILEFIRENGGMENTNIEDWRKRLKAEGFSEMEIQAVFARFDSDNDGQIDAQELASGARQLEEENAELDDRLVQLRRSQESAETVNAANLTTKDQMRGALDRIGTVETQVATLADKIELILEKLKEEAEKRQELVTQLESEKRA